MNIMVDRKEYMNQYRKEHLEQHRIANNKYTRTHKEQIKQHDIKFYREHKEQKDNYNKKWVKEHPEQVKKRRIKNQNKRRGLGYDYLNDKFEGSHGHHIDLESIVYIPEELHNSIHHSVLKNENMELINDKVFEWLIEHGVSTAILI